MQIIPLTTYPHSSTLGTHHKISRVGVESWDQGGIFFFFSFLLPPKEDGFFFSLFFFFSLPSRERIFFPWKFQNHLGPGARMIFFPLGHNTFFFFRPHCEGDFFLNFLPLPQKSNGAPLMLHSIIMWLFLFIRCYVLCDEC